jgi:hypothetical protein
MNRKRVIQLGTIATMLVIGVGATAGSCDTHQDAPEPTGKSIVNGTNAIVIQSADGYRNVYFSCFGTTGIYVTSAGGDDSLPSSVAVLGSDPACAK